MNKTAKRKSSDYRARLRAKGLRPVQIWVPDHRSGRLAEEARRQSLLASKSADEDEMLDFAEAVADWGGEP